ncbi:MAG: ornithine--oxo-acid transaminase [Trueperaceae bacterium]
MLTETRSNPLIDLENTYGAHNYKPLDIVIERAEGVWVWDIDGKKYLDCLSAYSALNQGHRHPKIIAALVAQAQKVTLTSRAFRNDQLGLLYKELAELTGYDMSILMNSGAEAVETAIKLVRKWAYVEKKIPLNQAEIIVMDGNFQGRTITIISFSTEGAYKDLFGPHTPGFKIVTYGDAIELEKSITPNTAAVMLEPIQGEAGVIVPPEGYLQAVRDLCNKHELLMVADEIQTGLGRTGKLFACDHEKVRPDVMILGKALGGGVYPVSAVLANKTIMSLFQPGEHGSTFGGNPLGATVARASLQVLCEEKLPRRSSELGEYFKAQLQTLTNPLIKEIRGKGLLLGVELTTKARPFCEGLAALGVLCKETHDNTIRFAPPLTIEKEQIDWAISQVKKVL